MCSFYRGPMMTEKKWHDEPQHESAANIAVREEPQPINGERMRLAQHEASHSIIFHRLGFKIRKAWIRDGRGACDVDNQNVEYVKNCTALLAGEANDQLRFGKEPLEDSHDRMTAQRLAILREKEHANHPWWGDTMKQCWREACKLVEENRKAIAILGHLIYDRGEVDGSAVDIVLRLCPAEPVRIRPYGDGFFRARSGSPQFTDPDDPLTQKLYGRAVAFWSNYYATR